jgi:DNA-binding response OmpR family regulator
MRRASHIAVVDESRECLQMLVAVLRANGLAVIGGRRPRPGQALPAFLRSDPALVVYDVCPPYAEELKLFRELRASAFPRAAVFLTTTDVRYLERWLREREVERVFLKPCDVQDLVTAVREVSKRARAAIER